MLDEMAIQTQTIREQHKEEVANMTSSHQVYSIIITLLLSLSTYASCQKLNVFYTYRCKTYSSYVSNLHCIIETCFFFVETTCVLI